DAQQDRVAADEWRMAAVKMDRERAIGWWLVAIVEGVDELLDADAVAIRHLAVFEEAPRDAVGRRVDVHRERRVAIDVGVLERINAGVAEVRRQARGRQRRRRAPPWRRSARRSWHRPRRGSRPWVVVGGRRTW